MSNKKAYYWSGAVDKKYKVKIIPQGKNQLVNFAMKKDETFRDDMDGISYRIYCDTPFMIYITKGKYTLVSMHSEETIKFWCSTLDDAADFAKELLYKKGDSYYIYKVVDNLYEMFMAEMKHRGEPLMVVNYEVA